MTTPRQALQQEFITLRNDRVKRPASSNTRLRNIYLDWLIESDELAEMRTDEELSREIERMKRDA